MILIRFDACAILRASGFHVIGHRFSSVICAREATRPPFASFMGKLRRDPLGPTLAAMLQARQITSASDPREMELLAEVYLAASISGAHVPALCDC